MAAQSTLVQSPTSSVTVLGPTSCKTRGASVSTTLGCSRFCQQGGAERRGCVQPGVDHSSSIYSARPAGCNLRDLAAGAPPDHRLSQAKRPHQYHRRDAAATRRGAALRRAGRHTQPAHYLRRNAAQAYRKEDASDPPATPAPPQAARREQRPKRRAAKAR